MGEIDKAENILILALVVVVGYGLYKFSQSFKSAIDGVFGLSSGDANTAPAGYGGTYTNAVNQTVSHPLDTLGTIVGLNQTQTPPAAAGSATDPSSDPNNWFGCVGSFCL